jgi:hypothetical protein
MKEEEFYSRILERTSQRSFAKDSTASKAVEESTKGKKKKKCKRELQER